ncbi:MAG: hypothetical protein VX951_13455 [Planctomycetota bacterium]|nr:hypothetical protein [Planctomycetota bacterium]
MAPWVIRIVVLATTTVVLWFFAPQAYQALAARIGEPGPMVDLDRVALRDAPSWLRTNPVLVRSALSELSPVLRGEFRQDDAAGLAQVVAALQELSWVESAALRPSHPDRLQLALELRRPGLEVVPEGLAAGRINPVLVSAAGICIRCEPGSAPSGLPVCRLLDGVLPGSLPIYQIGEEHPDPRVLSAASAAVEWRDQVRTRHPAMPELIEVDASNLGYRLLADPNYSEICVVLRRQDGGATRLAYGHPPGSPYPRVAIEDKLKVLGKILARYPGLNGLDKGDLRFVNLWENWLRPRPPSGSQSTAPK